MWTDQVSIKAVLIETNARGLKRKMFNPDGGVPQAGRMDTLCVCPSFDEGLDMPSQGEPMSCGSPQGKEGGPKETKNDMDSNAPPAARGATNI